MKRTAPSIAHNAETPADPDERRVFSRKEIAKERRHSLYQRAKEQRATDPRYLALKEAVKVQRRAVYQKVNERRKAIAADEKAKRKAERSAQCASKRREADEELKKLVTWVRNGSTPQND